MMVPRNVLRTLVDERAGDWGALTAKHEIRGEPAFHDFVEDGCLGVVLGLWGTGAVYGVEIGEGIPGEVAGAGEEERAGRSDARDGHYIVCMHEISTENAAKRTKSNLTARS